MTEDKNDSPVEGTTDKTSNESGDKRSSPSTLQQWQQRLLPFMVWMVAGLTLFFFVASFVQLAYLHVNIQQGPKVEVGSLSVPENIESPDQAHRFNVFAQLEASVLSQRYHQANVFLMSRVWARYLGFVTGMILALVGAAFILGKLREKPTELHAEGGGGAVSLRSTSPGIIMAVLGVALMATTIVTHHDITTAESSVYVQIPSAEKPQIDRTTSTDQDSLPADYP